MKRISILIACLLFRPLLAQQQVTYEEAVRLVYAHHPSIQAAEIEQLRQGQLLGALDLPKTEISLMAGQYNSIEHDNNITITQTIPFPSVWASQRALAKGYRNESEWKTKMVRNDLAKQVKTVFQQLLYYKARRKILIHQDSLFAELVKAVKLKQEVGEIGVLEKTVSETNYLEMQNRLRQNDMDIANSRLQLQYLLQTPDRVDASGEFQALQLSYSFDSMMLQHNPQWKYWNEQASIARHQRQLEVRRVLPEISLGYFTQTLIGFQQINGQDQFFGRDKRFGGFSVGIFVPVAYPVHHAKIRAAKLREEVVALERKAFDISLRADVEQALHALDKNASNLQYYETSALPYAALLEKQSIIALRNGEIEFSFFINNMQQVFNIRQNHLDALLQYNQNIITLEHLIGIEQ